MHTDWSIETQYYYTVCVIVGVLEPRRMKLIPKLVLMRILRKIQNETKEGRKVEWGVTAATTVAAKHCLVACCIPLTTDTCDLAICFPWLRKWKSLVFMMQNIVAALSHRKGSAQDMGQSCSPRLQPGQGVRLIISVWKVAFQQPPALSPSTRWDEIWRDIWALCWARDFSLLTPAPLARPPASTVLIPWNTNSSLYECSEDTDTHTARWGSLPFTISKYVCIFG